MGLLLQEYFIFMVVKDLFIMISQLVYGGFLGFWHAVILHIVTSPIDILVCLVLSIWGSAVLTQDGTAECSTDAECKPFILVARTNVILGYAAISES